MTNDKILEMALIQAAEDYGCKAEDFLKPDNMCVRFAPTARARKYLYPPYVLDMATYGSNIVCACARETEKPAYEYIEALDPERAFECPNINRLNAMLSPLGCEIAGMGEYFLPRMELVQALPSPLPIRMLYSKDFKDLYVPEFSNALCEKRKELDCLGAGAYDGGKLVAFAACSRDGEDMWQIGVDVLKEYRRQGLAAAVTSRLAMEILSLGKVPFYCCAWANVKSAKNALKCGFRPAWTQMYAGKKRQIME